jgi:predicted carbohydrate-binding protein with CBM5 and CBM33 domain
MSTSYIKLLLVGLLVSGADAHGCTTISRNKKCEEGSNNDCGDIKYEPQSLEARKAFPDNGPPDGQLASAGVERFAELNAQDPNRWVKTNVQAGPFAISWNIYANHRSTGWQYFLTKQDWNPSAALSRSSFDLLPFCEVSGYGNKPPDVITHNCDLPVRTGYQVILAVWTIADTVNAFYNMNDVQFDGVTSTERPSSPSPTPEPPPSPPSTPEPPSSPPSNIGSGIGFCN